MRFAPESVVELPAGQHRRVLCCVAFVGNPSVSIRWAISAMQIAFPVNAVRSVFCLAHENLDVSRNLTLYHWRAGLEDPRHSWIVLVPSDAEPPWDVALRGVIADVPAVALGGCYVIRGDAVGPAGAPWFVGGAWRGGEIVVLDSKVDLSAAPETAPAALPVGETLEQIASKTFAVAIPSLGRTTMAWTAHAIHLAGPMTSSRALVYAVGHEIGIARQRLVDAVLGMHPRPKYMLFLGDDMLPPGGALMTLFDTIAETGAKAVAGLYYMKMFPPATPILWRLDKPGALVPGRDFELGETIRVDGTGLDFVLFRTDALAAMPPLKFKTVMEYRAGQGMFMQTEDAFFWDRWRETHGEGPLVDTRCRVGHYSTLDGGVY